MECILLNEHVDNVSGVEVACVNFHVCLCSTLWSTGCLSAYFRYQRNIVGVLRQNVVTNTHSGRHRCYEDKQHRSLLLTRYPRETLLDSTFCLHASLSHPWGVEFSHFCVCRTRVQPADLKLPDGFDAAASCGGCLA